MKRDDHGLSDLMRVEGARHRNAGGGFYVVIRGLNKDVKRTAAENDAVDVQLAAELLAQNGRDGVEAVREWEAAPWGELPKSVEDVDTKPGRLWAGGLTSLVARVLTSRLQPSPCTTTPVKERVPSGKGAPPSASTGGAHTVFGDQTDGVTDSLGDREP
jgi:hypothetical protein